MIGPDWVERARRRPSGESRRCDRQGSAVMDHNAHSRVVSGRRPMTEARAYKGHGGLTRMAGTDKPTLAQTTIGERGGAAVPPDGATGRCPEGPAGPVGWADPHTAPGIDLDHRRHPREGWRLSDSPGNIRRGTRVPQASPIPALFRRPACRRHRPRIDQTTAAPTSNSHSRETPMVAPSSTDSTEPTGPTGPIDRAASQPGSTPPSPPTGLGPDSTAVTRGLATLGGLR